MYDKPNYTQAPNVFFDEHLSQIKSLSELKVTLVVFRNTIGWHEDSADMTTTELAKAAGMSRPSVIEGARLAIGRGTIKRVQKGRSFTYEPNILSVKNLNRSKRTIGKGVIPSSVNNLDRSDDLSLSSERNTKETKNDHARAKQSKPYREERYMLPPDSMLELSNEDQAWLRDKAPHVPDYDRATEKWFLKQQTNGGKSRTLEEWKASWRGYMMNYSDGEQSRNGHSKSGARGLDAVNQVLRESNGRG